MTSLAATMMTTPTATMLLKTAMEAGDSDVSDGGNDDHNNRKHAAQDRD